MGPSNSIQGESAEECLTPDSNQGFAIVIITTLEGSCTFGGGGGGSGQTFYSGGQLPGQSDCFTYCSPLVGTGALINRALGRLFSNTRRRHSLTSLETIVLVAASKLL